ncbi:MAG: Gfo/Idh/MocA family oxidoreductase [Geminocystis sp.]|nr:Gfo/Idh/MocA family oxidoreductase [Geminocystis sp.]MCS7148890.1 Gfo/Idh/MocA family oxidoreductase [Geminocystis sp.]MDW8116975.1 Gfo/Idh/MocA family oxidoreductase [Geminocystis sp.]
MGKQLKVAIIGTGFGQQVHIPAFNEHPRTRVVAVYNRSLEVARQIAAKHNIPYAFDDIEAICGCPEVDIVSIATPPFLRYEIAKTALHHDKHLFLEKPVNLNAYETREIYHIANSKGKAAVVDFEFRFVPHWQLLHQYLEMGYVGDIRMVKVDWLVPSRANPQRPWDWYSVKEKGGGVLGAIGSHAFDYIYWLFGEIATISAYLGNAIKKRPDPLANNQYKPVTADDICLITLELKSGTPVQINLSSVTYQGRGHWVEIYGDKGTLVLGSSNLKDYIHGFKLFASQNNQPLTEIPLPPSLAFSKTYEDGRIAPVIKVIDQLVKNIDNHQSFPPTLKEGVYSQLLMDLTHQSHNQKARLKVPSLEDFLSGRE